MLKKKSRIILFFGFLYLILFFIITFLGIKILNIKKYEKQILLGEKYLKELDYENAELCYLAALEIDDKKVEPYLSLANIYIETGQYEEARAILKKAEAFANEDDLALIQSLYEIIEEKIKVEEKDDIISYYKEFVSDQFDIANTIEYVVDVTRDGIEDLLVIDFTEENNNGVITGYVYTLDNNEIVKIYEKPGGTSHMHNFFEWYLYPTEEGMCLGEMYHYMWQGIGSLSYEIYYLTNDGQLCEVDCIEVSTETEGNADENGVILQDVYDDYIEKRNIYLSKSLNLYNNYEESNGSKDASQYLLFDPNEEISSAMNNADMNSEKDFQLANVIQEYDGKLYTLLNVKTSSELIQLPIFQRGLL